MFSALSLVCFGSFRCNSDSTFVTILAHLGARVTILFDSGWIWEPCWIRFWFNFGSEFENFRHCFSTEFWISSWIDFGRIFELI